MSINKYCLPEYNGPEIPGLTHAGNSSTAKTEDEAIDKYVSFLNNKVPRDCFRCIRFKGMFAVYVENQYADIANTIIEYVDTLLKLLLDEEDM